MRKTVLKALVLSLLLVGFSSQSYASHAYYIKLDSIHGESHAQPAQTPPRRP